MDQAICGLDRSAAFQLLSYEAVDLVKPVLFAATLALAVGLSLAPGIAEVCLVTGSTFPVSLLDLSLERAFIISIPMCVSAVFLMFIRISKVRRDITVTATAISVFLLVGSFTGLLAMLPSINFFYDRYSSVLRGVTTWSTSYTESSFRTIHTGMYPAAVRSQLGEPLARIEDGRRTVWVYSQIGQYRVIGDKGFHQRAVAFEDDKVDEIYRRFLTADHKPF